VWSGIHGSGQGSGGGRLGEEWGFGECEAARKFAGVAKEIAVDVHSAFIASSRGLPREAGQRRDRSPGGSCNKASLIIKYIE
jgi:hypothetical protein